MEAELREAFLDERRPAVDWVPFVAAQHSVSLVADPATSAAAERVCEILEASPSSSMVVSRPTSKNCGRFIPRWVRPT
ncbi:hypothetical protein AB0442_39745 [Kitasatospora sp. NPDC085895]|uniref:hypothetical protein n=1 Tax=Kitasatospora sp. NPDC085895 TaxID=3155057 RepID=UPI00344DB2F0